MLWDFLFVWVFFLYFVRDFIFSTNLIYIKMVQIAFHQTLKVDINNNLIPLLCKISQFYDECLQLRTGPKQFSRQCEKV